MDLPELEYPTNSTAGPAARLATAESCDRIFGKLSIRTSGFQRISSSLGSLARLLSDADDLLAENLSGDRDRDRKCPFPLYVKTLGVRLCSLPMEFAFDGGRELQRRASHPTE